MRFTQDEMDAESELVDDLVEMSRTVQTGLRSNEDPRVWRERRDQISALRDRIHAMRDEHLGSQRQSGRNSD